MHYTIFTKFYQENNEFKNVKAAHLAYMKVSHQSTFLNIVIIILSLLVESIRLMNIFDFDWSIRIKKALAQFECFLNFSVSASVYMDINIVVRFTSRYNAHNFITHHILLWFEINGHLIGFSVKFSVHIKAFASLRYFSIFTQLKRYKTQKSTNFFPKKILELFFIFLFKMIF